MNTALADVPAAATKSPSGLEYHRVLAGPQRQIGRGVLAITLLLAGALVLGWCTSQIAALLDAQTGRTNPTFGGRDVTPLFQAGNMAALALLIPWSMIIQRWLYGMPAASLHSVKSRLRFDLIGRAILLAGPIWVFVIVFSTVPGTPVPWTRADLVAMFAVTLLMTPLQSAGEEYGLRGLVFRVAGSWSKSSRGGLIVGTLVSSSIFVAMHLSPEPWHNVYYLAPAVSFAIITWRTGGLEVAIVIHAMNNTLLFLFNIVSHAQFASLQERSVEGGSALQLIPALATLAAMFVVCAVTRKPATPVERSAVAPLSEPAHR